jgi:hypothetical protein
MHTSSNLLLFTAVCFIAAGCASRPTQDPRATAQDSVCTKSAGNPLHLLSASTSSKPDVDPEIESILTQPTVDGRLLQINRHMYQSLQALDAELRGEQQLAACQQSLSGQLIAQSQESSGAGAPTARSARSADSADSIGGSEGSTGALSALGASPSAATGSQTTSATAHAPSSIVSTSASGTFSSSGSLRKARLPSGSGVGNGATAAKIAPGSDDDIVARRLRKAAEQETDPTLRAGLWKEYTSYKDGTSAK